MQLGFHAQTHEYFSETNAIYMSLYIHTSLHIVFDTFLPVRAYVGSYERAPNVYLISSNLGYIFEENLHFDKGNREKLYVNKIANQFHLIGFTKHAYRKNDARCRYYDL